jgi:hypothetical protein
MLPSRLVGRRFEMTTLTPQGILVKRAVARRTYVAFTSSVLDLVRGDEEILSVV